MKKHIELSRVSKFSGRWLTAVFAVNGFVCS